MLFLQGGVKILSSATVSAIALITWFTSLAVAQAVGELQHCQFISRGLFIDTVHGCHV